MDHVTSQALLATVSKHDIAGVVAAIVALVLLVFGFARIAAKAAGAVLWPVLGVLAAVVAVLMFTRAV
jgi:uncharacterized membrane protein